MTDDSLFIRTPEDETRRLVCAIARSQEGNEEPAKYWRDVLPNHDPPWPRHWCGALDLWVYHQAGLLLGVNWIIGSGLSHPQFKLQLTTEPKLGDLAYFRRNQHYAIAVDVSPGMVQLVNGNSRNDSNKTGPSKVIINEKPRASVSAFYSIAGVLPK